MLGQLAGFWKKIFKTQSPVISTFEQIMLTRRIHYVPYWMGVGIVAFVAGELLIRFYGEQGFIWTQLAFAVNASAIPIFGISARHLIVRMMRNLESVLEPPVDSIDAWIEQKSSELFTLDTWSAKALTFSFNALGTLTVLWLGLPFHSGVLNVIGLSGMEFVFAITGLAAYFSLASLRFLAEVVRYPLKIKFYRLPHPAISFMLNLYSLMALEYTLGYVVFLIAIWRGPYGLVPEMIAWLTLGTFFPSRFFSLPSSRYILLCVVSKSNTLTSSITRSRLHLVRFVLHHLMTMQTTWRK